MDSWTDKQIQQMIAGGNDASNRFLGARGVEKGREIRSKYNSEPAMLYKEVLKAKVEVSVTFVSISLPDTQIISIQISIIKPRYH